MMVLSTTYTILKLLWFLTATASVAVGQVNARPRQRQRPRAMPGSTAEEYLVKSLPGFSNYNALTFKNYAGFMPLGDPYGTHLFFWFATSMSNPSTDPLLLWTNGGPGSSSLAYGFWTEHGPFRLAQDGATVELYNYSWNRRANVVYVEQPSGVGFSYSRNTSHYATNDKQAAVDNLLFLKAFFKVFTHFQSNPFYLTGESYGGHYIPQLAAQILDDQPFYKQLNMKGFWIGNPGLNSDWYFNVDEYAFLTFMYQHGLLPQKAYVQVRNACDWKEFLTNCGMDFTKPSDACVHAAHNAWKFLPKTFDPYNVLVGTCHTKGVGRAFVKSYTPFLEHRRLHYNRSDIEYNPCINTFTPKYMRRTDVLRAVHADLNPNVNWPNTRSTWTYGSELADIMKLFPRFLKEAPHWKISVVSGTADAAVPFIGTQRELECLGLKVIKAGLFFYALDAHNETIKKDWEYWMLDGDVAGARLQYDGLEFMTVKGCGHTIPTYCPKQGAAMLDLYLGTGSSYEHRFQTME